MINMPALVWHVWFLWTIQKHLEKMDTKLVSYKYRLKHKTVIEKGLVLLGSNFDF